MNREIKICKHIISENSPAYIVAEMSGNHNMSFDRAKEIIKAAKEAGADAIKIQTYTADTITMDSSRPEFRTEDGSLWEGMTLYELYKKAYTPWEWQGELMQYAKELDIDFFSSPFDLTAVDFLEELDVPAYKVASYEINDIPLIRKIAATKKPVIISTGIAWLNDIDLAMRTCREQGNDNIILLKCISEYPAPYENMNLKVIPNMSQTFECTAGISDHTPGSEIAVAAVALGAKVIEKHFTLKRSDGGVDSAFSMEKEEFADMVRQIRNVEKALGHVSYELNDRQISGRSGSRSLYVTENIKKGETFSEKNLRSIRPANGMHTMYYDEILGKRARTDIEKGTPMEWRFVE